MKFKSEDGTMFSVIAKYGDHGYWVYCEHGGWTALYGHGMKMATCWMGGYEEVKMWFYDDVKPMKLIEV